MIYLLLALLVIDLVLLIGILIGSIRLWQLIVQAATADGVLHLNPDVVARIRAGIADRSGDVEM